ncbi:protein ARABIDILLO 1-like protein isoform X1 [Cinnamomum micranthum f. kanehirae]|uniref:Protein ARABIDILLO 1-like protein isoform X1 n=1 Tax=Cinnamomum micranthum f. kanehirae TaxID=337451 RepID=A0A3S3Q8E6_9MAGN|nr:protein ARABIDILLO 1-like protein isoform X1 [Cinnamomum micranthum f. kanehirae]
MSRRVRRKGVQYGEKAAKEAAPPPRSFSATCDGMWLRSGRKEVEEEEVDWTSLPDDTVVQLFSCLNYRDRASLASTCSNWRALGSSPCLWSSLDLRAHRCDAATAASLASRCSSLQKLRFRGTEAAAATMNLQARGLREVSGDFCRDITDATLSMMAARHEALESLQIGPDFCERITSDAIRVVALCCPKLKRLRLSGIRDVNGDAINALAKNCGQLVEIGFMDCGSVDGVALGNVASLRFVSVAGTRCVKWSVASLPWSKLPNLIGVDVSRTDVSANAVSKLRSSSQTLKVLCALNCPLLEDEGNAASYNAKGKLLLALFTDIFKGIGSLFADSEMKEREVFWVWRNSKRADKNLNEVMNWIEWVLSHSLLRIAETNPVGLDNFWLRQGAPLLLSLMQSLQEDVQERAATGLATFVVIDDESATVDCGRAEAVMQDGGIRLLLDLARSCREGVQSEAAKAIANLSVNPKVAKAVADEGGIGILADLARSMNRLVAEEAAGGLWNLSVGEEHKGAIAEAGGVKALVDLIFKWPSGGDGVLERAAGALANLAADDKCSMEVALVGGVHALVTLARSCKFEGVQEQAARALANLAAHGDSNSNNAAVGKEAGALEALVQLTCSHHEGVRQEAAGALWNLSFDDRNREAIAAVGGVEALVALAQTCSNASHGLQERAAGALWGLSVSEANSIAIGREGGVAPLIALARSDVEDVHETAAGALWNLAFNPGNALRIVEEGGVPALVHLCSSSASKMARFMAALALAYMFDGRMDAVASNGFSSEGISKSVNLDGARRMALKHIEEFVSTFSDPQLFSAAASSSTPAPLAQVAELARIQEAGHLRCSGAEIGRFVTMLRNHSSILRACATFALLQFTIPSGRHSEHHVDLLQKAAAARALRAAAASATGPVEAKIFAKIVLRNLEHYQVKPST